MTTIQWLDSFPGFSALDSDLKNAYISMSSGCIDSSNFCAPASYVYALYAAHLYSISSRPGGGLSGGPVNSVSEGDISIAYGSDSSTQNEYMRSSYGATLYGFIKREITGMQLI